MIKTYILIGFYNTDPLLTWMSEDDYKDTWGQCNEEEDDVYTYTDTDVTFHCQPCHDYVAMAISTPITAGSITPLLDRARAYLREAGKICKHG